VKIYELDRTLVIAVRFSEIDFSCSSSGEGHALFLSLNTPPTFECELTRAEADEIKSNPNFRGNIYDVYPRVRLTELSPEHKRYVPYTSLALRLVFQNLDALQQFKKHCQTTNLHVPRNEFVRTASRGIFTPFIMDEVQTWLLHLPWSVAFQIEGLLRSLSIEPNEVLALRPSIEAVIQSYGAHFAAKFLSHFAPRVKTLGRDESDTEGYIKKGINIKKCFNMCLTEYHRIHATTMKAAKDQSDNYDSLHVIITPTTMYLEGPFPERSNRVIRSFPVDKQSSFIRVSFTDENRLQYRFDREVDGPGFIRTHVGGKLHSSLLVAGRQFQFLAYSQSALKEHSVIFVKPFSHDGKRVNAASIIEGLGNFRDLEFDRRLIYCPARYGARVSQAFTATDSSVEVEVEEIFPINDIETKVGEKTWCHTDGVGRFDTIFLV
jgi:RNA-dependent RNA polymerase